MTRTRVRLAAGVRRPRAELLLGGSPLRLLRLAPEGARALDALLAGAPHPAAGALLSRLHAAGMVLPEPGPGRTQDVTVVLPVRGTRDEVQVVLDGVPDGVPVVVVDDGSPQPLHLPGFDVMRHGTSRGPAAARNAGAARATTALIAFVDADVHLPDGWLGRLTGHFADHRVVAVAPRVRSGPAPGAAGVLEQQLSALDLGDAPGEVRAGTHLSYVPSTVLLVRREAFLQAGGFDERLHVGEDVDLVWRLCREGIVRYDPAVSVTHGARASLRAAVSRRRDYGTAAGQLDVRHPGAMRHLLLPPQAALVWTAALLHPAAAVAGIAELVGRAPAALPALPPAVARRLVLQSQLSALAATGRYALRPGLPLVLASAAASSRMRRLLPILAAGYVWDVRRDVRAGPEQLGLRLVEDVAYSVGVWQGCLRAGRWRPLVPGFPSRRQPSG